MFKLIILLLLLCPGSQVFANDEPATPASTVTNIGSHIMVLVTFNNNVYASLLPQYRSGLDVQLVYQIDSKYVPLLHLVNDADLVTIKPQPFDLQSLIRGEKLTVKADIYMGHAEKDGSLTLPEIDLNFDTQLYLRVLEDLPPSTTTQVYDAVDLNNGRRLLIHQIQSAPSYDHLLLLLDDVSCLTTFRTTNAVAIPSEIYQKLAFCGSLKPLYYNAEDFMEDPLASGQNPQRR